MDKGRWMPVEGLSPRVRGNHMVGTGIDGLGVARVYPRACGGTSTFWYQPNQLMPPGVYPRACGGTGMAIYGQRTVAAGLSPRVRGNQDLARGKVASNMGLSPRVRGNRFLRSCAAIDRVRGLSPRVRGNPARENLHPILEGSIPARAGEPPWPA